MMVRLRDWAEVNRISERTVQIHIKENWGTLEGHVDRRGKQGTWLDEFAQDFLLQRIQLPKQEEVFIPSAREAALMYQINEISMKLADAERRAALNAEAAGKVALLEEHKAAQEAHIADLRAERDDLKVKAQVAAIDAQKAQQEVEQKEEELKKKNARIEELESRTFGDYLKILFRKK